MQSGPAPAFARRGAALVSGEGSALGYETPAGPWNFVVELSNNATDWRPIARAQGGRQACEIPAYDAAAMARFLRFRFPNVTSESPAALSELRVFTHPKETPRAQ